MTTKANRAREAQKRIEKAKKRYGLEPGTGAAFLRLAMTWAESPYVLAATVAVLVACVVVLIL